MKKLLLFVTIFLFARENPFIPVVTNNSNYKIKKKFFLHKKITLPNDARVLKSFVIYYQTLNGTIKKLEIPIQEEIDWHTPLSISTTKSKLLIKKIDLKFLTLYVKNNQIFLKTDDKIVRSFFLVEPFRFVIDFNGKKNFITISKDTDFYIKKIVLGNHKKFYRMVLYLDGAYKIKIKKRVEGYKIEFQ